jgi:3-methyl-2-oxobutanoate hydroxymethyltransferase
MEHKKLTIRDIQAKKGKSKITFTSVNDVSTAKIVDASGADMAGAGAVVAAMSIMGYTRSLSSEMWQVLVYLRPIAQALKRALLSATLPYGTYQASNEDAIAAGVEYMKAGVDCIKIEGAGIMVDRIHAVVSAGIPCMGHVGMAPQQIVTTGGYRVVGGTAEEAMQVLSDSLLLQDAGVWALEVECVPDRVAEVITKRVRIPTIGTGSGAGCDGQGLVAMDIWGLPQPVAPRLAKRYDDLYSAGTEALLAFRQDVKNRRLVPTEKAVTIPNNEFDRFMDMVG